jgi:hypothetical protein
MRGYGEHQSRTYLPRQLAQIAIVPDGIDAFVERRLFALAVPADPETVAIGRMGPKPSMQALVDQRVLGLVEYRFSKIGLPNKRANGTCSALLSEWLEKHLRKALHIGGKCGMPCIWRPAVLEAGAKIDRLVRVSGR